MTSKGLVRFACLAILVGGGLGCGRTPVPILNPLEKMAKQKFEEVEKVMNESAEPGDSGPVLKRGPSGDPKQEALRLRDQGSDFLRRRNHAKAVKCFNESIELNPKDHLAYNERGVAYTWLEKDDEAIADFSKAIELNDQFFLAWRSRGSAYSRRGKYEEALKDLNRAIKLEPAYARAYRARGEVYAKLGRQAEAEEDLRTAGALERELAGAGKAPVK